MLGAPTTCVSPLSATEPSASVWAAVVSSSGVRPITSSSLLSGLFGLAAIEMVGPLRFGTDTPAGFWSLVANTTALPFGTVSKLAGKVAPLYEARLPNQDATRRAACKVAGDGLAEN